MKKIELRESYHHLSPNNANNYLKLLAVERDVRFYNGLGICGITGVLVLLLALIL